MLLSGSKNYPIQNAYFGKEDIEKLDDGIRESIVPIDDRKSIRRIIFDPVQLKISK